MKRYDTLTDINLKVLYEKESKRMYESEFINEDGNQIENWDVRTELLSEYMESKGLISIDGEMCYISKFGEELVEDNGWLNYLEKELKSYENKKKKEIRKETQEEIIRKGTIESFKYGKCGFYLAIISIVITVLLELLR
ncbi:hypothetical protein [Polaribacter sargassicola]|uniref:hypothetical protein n=1 Tax=Polaribacter sargassicola TaxID=2836891 RepID=UPI001F17CE5A|nr:hypothetical protein [Polaribacter sp. DS7-9]MCG1037077.1 hypothetical protein [Polaribacter sp. DS7-9]